MGYFFWLTERTQTFNSAWLAGTTDNNNVAAATTSQLDTWRLLHCFYSHTLSLHPQYLALDSTMFGDPSAMDVDEPPRKREFYWP